MAVVGLPSPLDDAGAGESVIVFVGGCDRSGTTLVGKILAEQLSLVSLPEAYFHAVAFRRYGPKVSSAIAVGHWRRRSWGIDPGATSERQPLPAYLRSRMTELHDGRRGSGHPLRVVESTPENIEIGSILLEEFPEAHIIHLVRDPRGVTASLRRMDFGPRTAQECARLWKQRIASGLALEMRYPDRVHRLRYEDLLACPDDVGPIARSVAASPQPFVAERDLMVEFSSRSLQKRSSRGIDISQAWAWRNVLTTEQIGAIEFECRELMGLFGYPLDGAPDPRSSTRRRLNSLLSVTDELTLSMARRALRVGRALLRRR